MANEIRINLRVNAEKDNLSERIADSFTLDMSGSRFWTDTLDLTTNYEIINIPVWDNLGLALFTNLDENDVVEIGSIENPAYGGDYAPFARIPPGATNLINLDNRDYAARSASGSAQLLVRVFER